MRRRKLGLAFSDQLAKNQVGSSPSKSKKEVSWKDNLLYGYNDSVETEHTSSWRRISLLIVFLFIFFGLFLRLFHLSVVEGAKNRELADSNRIKIKVIHAPRGVIYDRNGKILSQNDPGFRLTESSGSAVVSHQISRDQAISMEVSNDHRYKDLEIDSLRSYPLGEKAAHIVGYVGQISPEQLKLSQYSDYKSGDVIGLSGVEKTYEKVLRGVDGGEVIEVDSLGREVRTITKTDPIPGQNLYLSIDSDLQSFAYDTLKAQVAKVGSCCGALVAEDPKSGQILALASIPSFDPKDLSSSLLNPNSPLLNRAIAGEYPPGSTFKIASSLAALSSGKISPTTQYEDTGIMSLGPFTFANWYFTEYGKKEGPVDLLKAIQRSNDIYFYHVGETVGENFLAGTAKKLGMGKILGIDLPGEEPGLIPDDAWKEQNVGQPWYPGDTLHMAIGQGYVLTTPLQILNLTSTVAADGKQYPPHLAYKITSPYGVVIKNFRFDDFSSPDFKPDQIQLVKQGLEEVPKNGGTAWPFFTFSISTAGKTGTAEYGDNTHTHAWYTSYAPANDPKIALTVLIEAAGEGSNDSAPVAKSIYQWYFSKDKNHLTNFDVAPIATAAAKTLGE